MKKVSLLIRRLISVQPCVPSRGTSPVAGQECGFALPTAMGLGLCMIALGVTIMLLAQDDRDTAVVRRDYAASMLTADSAIAEILASFGQRENAILLGKTYDPINPQTGKVYLGLDGIPNSGDEGTAAIDEWQSLNPNCLSDLGITPPNLSLVQTVNVRSSYKILAYRYDANQQSGDLLVEGTRKGMTSRVHVNLRITHDSHLFPSVISDNVSLWQGRELTGSQGHLYFDPNEAPNDPLTGKASPGEAQRADYLNAVGSGPADGFSGDAIQGDLVACVVTFTMPHTAQGSSLGVVNTSQTLAGSTGVITQYQADQIDLSGTEELQVDTTNGPVYLYVKGTTALRDSAKIRNVRSDGALPAVGDLRIIQTQTGGTPVLLYGTSCIEHAFVYSPEVDFRLLSTGDGCPGDSNSNVVGVVWAEDIENSNAGVTGIEVPTDLSSLVDALESVNLPVFYRIRGVNSWSRVRI
ncbi:hypothetical protein [Lyngbya confervoides]|uniref:Uncharacterized protein n=1 Tax=Lyngbya confervoides BDU141951 TaxID=1574623 RepID=A0ABD4T6R0_9CYAN|nr:hypothetical protein [Lyngbya confervoides]MCM1983952.1 hypothetical protein [Lyngbya confervoides BDU141951]